MVHQARGLASGSNANLSDMRITEEFLSKIDNYSEETTKRLKKFIETIITKLNSRIDKIQMKIEYLNKKYK